MYIKQLIIEGFKSYGTRTVINGWDPSFTAITGENGSGKSNILDAICFVLGISQLAHVRASSLRELVYKQGQAGVTKASVTVVFDNTDKANSPIGYEQYQELTVTRQVVVNGKNKYLINGHMAQLNRVQNLFHSVQLNISNPTFLVMQGRITKVLNMKPPEILGLLEEAAGTRMYETKKTAALNTIEKKELKVAEINKTLSEEITPQLEKLRRECALFHKWSANATDIQRLDRRATAYRFVQAEQSLNAPIAVEYKNSVDDLHTKEADLRAEIDSVSNELAVAENCASNEAKSAIDDLQEAVASDAKLCVQYKTNVEGLEKTLAEEQSLLDSVRNEYDNALKTIEGAKASAESLFQERSSLDAQRRQYEDAIASMEGQAIGINIGDGQGSSAAQLMEAGRLQAEASAARDQALVKVHHLQKTVKEKQNSLAKASPTFHQLLQERTALEKRIDADLEKLRQYDAPKISESLRDVDGRITTCQGEVELWNERVAQLRAQAARFDFQFTSPSASFDRSSVKGRVAKLIAVRQDEFAIALEVIAGGRLYNVVVDNQNTGKQLLKKGNLTQRVTVIPLAQIRPTQKITSELLKRAQRAVGADNVWVATSLVDYPRDVEPAVEFVFGSSFVCRTSGAAKTVTFDPAIRRRSATLEGDVLNPEGTLRGGSRPSSRAALAVLSELAKATESRDVAQASLDDLRQQYSSLKSQGDAARALQLAIDGAQQDLEMLNSRVEKSECHALQVEVDNLNDHIKMLQEEAALAETNAAAYAEKSRLLEESVNAARDQRGRKSEEIEKSMRAANDALASVNEKLRDLQQKCHRAELEITQQSEQANGLMSSIKSAEINMAKLRDKLNSAGQLYTEAQTTYESRSSELEAQRGILRDRNKEAQELAKKLEKLQKSLSDVELEIKKLSHQLSRHQKDQDTARQRIDELLKAHAWIRAEKHLFGKANTPYDFASQNPERDAALLAEKKAEQAQIERKLNKKVVGMMEKAEHEYQELLKRRSIVLADKAKIEQVIVDLDRNKNQVLQTIWDKVNRDFGSIFSMLLPGAFAKLEPPTGGTVLDGLEVKVAFGGIWKESLSELSGGQRSLLALSLILALLLYKPAPMYILDEVDAALDLSHTQNIGHMLRTHFSKSQFIVVSLKDGMFNNANVIFRTKFVDGVSTVTMAKS
ncbi:unnamed protein product (mitochondrion) [Plasmodiophora brassicae]|uniref:SMC hinge domain-containing protein n=1 Tax=Plasmodiophora brassicae TaxID=37360 RepID=A0A3P3YGA0_PLABS|nr:unnamed protein product [Plasmodiophora brassicae]